MKAHGNVLLGVMEHDLTQNKIQFLDIFLTAMSAFLNDNICLLMPGYIWITEEMSTLEDVRDFQYFLVLDNGHFMYVMKEEVLMARGIPFPSTAEDDALLDWMRHPDTKQCKRLCTLNVYASLQRIIKPKL